MNIYLYITHSIINKIKIEMIKKNISFEILKLNNDNLENIEKEFLNFDYNLNDYFKKYEENEKDEVESLSPNTDDNCDSDIDLENLDDFLSKQKNIPDNMQTKINNDNSKNRYLSFVLATNENDKINNTEKNNYYDNDNNNDNDKDNTFSRIIQLEIENQILKNEINELKEKMQSFEIFMLNFQTSSISTCSSNGDINSSLQIDKLKTMVKETQYEMKKMKDQFEYIEALESENRDKIEVLETLIENFK